MPEAALGTKLKIGANSIATLTSIGGLELSADTIDVTTLDSDGYREFIQGLKDAGEVAISGFFNPADTNGQKALYDNFDSGALTAFSIVFPSNMGAEWGFNAIVTGFSTGAEMEDAVTFEASLKVSGKPTLGLTASTGLFDLSLTGAGGELTPGFAASTYSYSFSGVTADSVTITATAANHTLKLYVDGAFVQNLVTGSPSGAIAMATVGSKKLTILAQETGKSTKTYEVIVVKTA